MNLYLAVSEPVASDEPYGDDNRIDELVVARTHSHASYLAWKNHDFFRGWWPIKRKPTFAVRIKQHDVEGPARIVSYESWANKLPGAWDLGKAPHIGFN